MKGGYSAHDKECWNLRRQEVFNGHKMHMNMNAAGGLITGVVSPGGTSHSGHELEGFIIHGPKVELPTRMATTRHGYDDTSNH